MAALITDARRRTLIACLFFLSGSTGLVFEVVFTRLLQHIFGSTAYAASTVLAAFMGGLAIGSAVLGRLADRVRRPLLVYGLVELAIGLYCVTAPRIFDYLTTLYVDLHQTYNLSLSSVTALQFSLSFAVILVPTILMGFTLPLLSRHVTHTEGDSVGGGVSRLYSINTAGAAFGTLTATFVLTEWLGTAGTIQWTAIANTLIFLVSAGLAFTLPPMDTTAGPGDGEAGAAPARPPRPEGHRLMLLGAFASGCISFMYEVVFVHTLALVAGTSVYAFGAMLFVFLMGLTVGARLARRRLEEGRVPPAGMFGIYQMFAGLIVVFSLPLWAYLPYVFTAAGVISPGFLMRSVVRIVACGIMMFPPAILLGTAFPLLLGAAAKDKRWVGRSVGSLYFINTIGAILGATMSGFVIIPALGAQTTMAVLAACSLAIGAMFVLRFNPEEPKRRVVQVAVIVTLGGLLLPAWAPKALNSTQWLYFSGPRAFDRVVFKHEDVHGGFTTVIERDFPDGTQKRTLLTNGKFQGDDTTQMNAQRAFAHLPMLHTPRLGDALIIGLGTGVTAGELALYDFNRIDIAELAPGIVEAARDWFDHVNRRVLTDDPRVHMIVDDGRNHLMLEDDKYDLITLEISSIWFAGAASLYSVDFYDLLKDRLTEGGVLQQWVQFHHIETLDLIRIIGSLREVFPYVHLWESGGQGMLTATMKPRPFDMARIADYDKMVTGADMMANFRELLLEPAEIDAALADYRAKANRPAHFLLSTDEHPYLEYSTPRGYVLQHAEVENVRYLSSFKRHTEPTFKHALTPTERAALRAALRRRDAARAQEAKERLAEKRGKKKT